MGGKRIGDTVTGASAEAGYVIAQLMVEEMRSPSVPKAKRLVTCSLPTREYNITMPRLRHIANLASGNRKLHTTFSTTQVRNEIHALTLFDVERLAVGFAVHDPLRLEHDTRIPPTDRGSKRTFARSIKRGWPLTGNSSLSAATSDNVLPLVAS